MYYFRHVDKMNGAFNYWGLQWHHDYVRTSQPSIISYSSKQNPTCGCFCRACPIRPFPLVTHMSSDLLGPGMGTPLQTQTG